MEVGYRDHQPHAADASWQCGATRGHRDAVTAGTFACGCWDNKLTEGGQVLADCAPPAPPPSWGDWPSSFSTRFCLV